MARVRLDTVAASLFLLFFLALAKAQAAVEDYSQAISIDPKYVEGYRKRGLAYHELGEEQKAVNDYSHAIALSPKPFKWDYYYRAEAYYSLLPPTISINAEQNPQEEKALTEWTSGSRYKKAIEDYTKAISLDPKFAMAYAGRGLVYSRLQQYQKAINDHTTAIHLDPNNSWLYYIRGLDYDTLGQRQRAIEEFSKAIGLDPKDARAYFMRGARYENLGQHEKARADYNKAISIDPRGHWAAMTYVSFGHVYADLKQYQKAIAEYNKALSINPQDKLANTSAYLNRSRAYCELGQHEKGIEDFMKFADDHDPNADAAGYYQSAIKDHPKSPWAYVGLAEAWSKIGIVGAAGQEIIENCTKAISIDPKYTRAYVIRGNVYDNLGKYLEDRIQEGSFQWAPPPAAALSFSTLPVTMAQLKQNRLAELENVFSKAIADYEIAYGNTDLRLAECFASLGKAQDAEGKDTQAIQSFKQELYIKAKHSDESQVFFYHEELPNCEHFYKNGIAYTKITGKDIGVEIVCIPPSNNVLRVDMQVINNGVKPIDVLPENVGLNMSGTNPQRLQQINSNIPQQMQLVANTVAPGADIAGALCFQLPQDQIQNPGELRIVIDKMAFVFDLFIRPQNVTVL